ncbi:MAG: hypothetical protein D4R83_05110 [Streptomycetaceae bacterium]|nr:MAG: hypothetical protein D4R83_05110 [Streptomycetaceae bacterium]
MLNDESNVPARAHWHRPHMGEHRWPISIIVLLVITLQYVLPVSLSLPFQGYICILEAVLLGAVFIINPRRISQHIPTTRTLGLLLVVVMSLSNTGSAVKLIDAIITRGVTDAKSLFLSGGSIWLTNVVVFALWFWELDRGGPGKRAQATHPYPDFIFPQMSDPRYAPKEWHPKFFDYLYTSFTNASAFSPTDVMPLTRWAKLLMLFQSMTALLIVGLVIARAVNILH